MEKPLVSVVMPVYNGEKYIQRAVDSVFEQKVSPVSYTHLTLPTIA